MRVNRSKVINMVFIVCLLFVSSACSQKLAIRPTEPIVAYSMAEVDRALNKSNWETTTKVAETTLNEVPRLKGNSNLEDYRPNRAFVIGYPNQ